MRRGIRIYEKGEPAFQGLIFEDFWWKQAVMTVPCFKLKFDDPINQ